VYNMEVLETLRDHLDAWNPTNDLGIKQAKKHARMWERMGQLVLAPDLAAMSRHRMCKGSIEEERKAIFDIVLPKMEQCGWNVKLAFLRFWEGERSLDALLKGMSDKNDIQLVRYVFATYFEPLMARGGVKVSLEEQVDVFYREHIVALTRMVQLTSDKTFKNGRMRFEGRGMAGERHKVMAEFLPQIEDAGFAITAKIISLWNDERDADTLFGELDDKSRLLMEKLWRLLQVEESSVAGDGCDSTPAAGGASVALQSSDGMEKLFGSADLMLLAPDGKTVRVRALAQYEVVGIFFSGHWCPPSRTFTPELVRAYKSMRADGKSLEIVFVSSDHDQKEFSSYFSKMPWLALPFAMGGLKERLSNKYKVEGIPTLVLLDGSTAQLLTPKGREVINNDPRGELFPWYPTSRSTRSS